MRLLGLVLLGFSLILSGCVVRQYPVTRDRIDQDLTAGNRGYLKGQGPLETEERKSTRTTHVVEVEFKPWLTFEKKASTTKAEQVAAPMIEESQDLSLEGNRGYITQSEVPAETVNIQRYTVQKGDTLQKISKKFYGTTKKWMKIYNANRETLKAPDRVYPGQVINIPVEPGETIPEHLK